MQFFSRTVPPIGQPGYDKIREGTAASTDFSKVQELIKEPATRAKAVEILADYFDTHPKVAFSFLADLVKLEITTDPFPSSEALTRSLTIFENALRAKDFEARDALENLLLRLAVPNEREKFFAAILELAEKNSQPVCLLETCLDHGSSLNSLMGVQVDALSTCTELTTTVLDGKTQLAACCAKINSYLILTTRVGPQFNQARELAVNRLAASSTTEAISTLRDTASKLLEQPLSQIPAAHLFKVSTAVARAKLPEQSKRIFVEMQLTQADSDTLAEFQKYFASTSNAHNLEEKFAQFAAAPSAPAEFHNWALAQLKEQDSPLGHLELALLASTSETRVWALEQCYETLSIRAETIRQATRKPLPMPKLLEFALELSRHYYSDRKSVALIGPILSRVIDLSFGDPEVAVSRSELIRGLITLSTSTNKQIRQSALSGLAHLSHEYWFAKWLDFFSPLDYLRKKGEALLRLRPH
jgi:hypothetical protein